MRIIGIQWLANLLHPQEYSIDIDQRVAEFYELFLDVKLTQEQINKIVGKEHE